VATPLTEATVTNQAKKSFYRATRAILIDMYTSIKECIIYKVLKEKYQEQEVLILVQPSTKKSELIICKLIYLNLFRKKGKKEEE
jgi:hypothetical protein